MACTCGNPAYGFECMCEWMKNNPGDTEFTCDFCGIYTASKPRCSHCDVNDYAPENTDNRRH